MANKKMLIDATHPEETRVVVVRGNRLEELDVESAARKQLKGNIYLAKITRVEPSLQAAFVDYGGNRHGFLPFSEIHPDYYQIPVEDREALLAEERQRAAADEESDVNSDDMGDDDRSNGASVETVGGDDSDEVEARPRSRNTRNYKIQEVIKRRQIILVQVVKEERGNKGAALTTYLSLAGRYCVLMPNTARGGGISRKIANVKDRKRLRSVLNEMKISEGMAVIVRTAGAERSKAEIRRDYDYLVRLWDKVRTMTLDSIAPAMVYEEANLIKRSIRDLYDREVDEIVVEGDEGYRTAKDFIKMLVPSHAKRVQPYREQLVPLFHRYQIESQLDAMHSATVQLRSGGYIVINPTEALVAIDVNSGRATKERNIEETAHKTNLEAAEEIARQLRLRDLAGLIVIDFIDMEGSRNQSNVERKLKEAMRHDRARIQIGRISPFGLLEMSRQRLRPSLLETSTEVCPFCAGAGVRRSIESTALHVLRAVEEEGIRRRTDEMTVHMPTDVALYILNQKRDTLADIERRFELSVHITRDDSLIAPDHRIDRTRIRDVVEHAQKTEDAAPQAKSEPQAQAQTQAQEQTQTRDESTDQPEEGGKRRRRRRSRRKRRDGVDAVSTEETSATETGEAATPDAEKPENVTKDDDDGQPKKRRRRGKRGGRRRRRDNDVDTSQNTAGDETASDETIQGGDQSAAPADASPTDEAAEAVETADANADAAAKTVTEPSDEPKKPPRRRRSRRSRTSEGDVAAEPTETAQAVSSDDVTVQAEPEAQPAEPAAAQASEEADPQDQPKPKRSRRRSPSKKTVEQTSDEAKAEPEVKAAPEAIVITEPAKEAAPEKSAPVEAPESVVIIKSDGSTEEVKPKARGGWWRR